MRSCSMESSSRPRGGAGDKFKAAAGERKLLEEIIDGEVAGVCMHSGELQYKTIENTRAAIVAAEFAYETICQNQYYQPPRLPSDNHVHAQHRSATTS